VNLAQRAPLIPTCPVAVTSEAFHGLILCQRAVVAAQQLKALAQAYTVTV